MHSDTRNPHSFAALMARRISASVTIARLDIVQPFRNVPLKRVEERALRDDLGRDHLAVVFEEVFTKSVAWLEA